MAKRTILILAALWCVTFALLAANPPSGGANKISVTRTPQGEIIVSGEIRIQSLIPNLDTIVAKTDTYIPAGVYSFTLTPGILRRESVRQIEQWKSKMNKWLEESK